MLVKRECKHPTCEGKCRRPPKPKRRTPLPKVSAKREKLNRVYSKKRKQFFKEGDMCEAGLPGCTIEATDLHHPAGRMGNRLIEVERCKKVCRSCHRKLEEDPRLAKELGLSESRLVNHSS